VSRPGIVAAGHPAVAEAAACVLRAGGNAFDAAVAAGFASAVAEPALTSLGGGGFLLARTAEGWEALFDFFVDTPGRGLAPGALDPHFLPVVVRFPASEQVFNVGLGSVAVPGNVRGFLHVQRRLGRLPLRETLAPAVALARDGIELNAPQAYFLSLLEPIMTLTERGRSLFAPGGRYARRGARLRNLDLASFLASLAGDGERELYEGAIARQVAREMREGGGLLTEADLRAYRVVERDPARATYRGIRLLTNPPPSFGGSLLAFSLRLLEACELRALPPGSAPHLVRLVAVMQEADRRREAVLARPASPAGALLHESLERVRTASGGTTHVSVADAEGNVASMTTSNGEGSGYLVPGTGVMLNNMMGEDDLHPDGFHASPPGLRVASMMAPSVLLDGSRPRVVLGSGGSKRIRTALLQVISRVVDFDQDLRDAVEEPRVHWDGTCVQAEPGFAPEALARLRERWSVNEWPVRDIYFGGAHAVSPDGAAAGDPRRGGSTARV
jgi:gamma-glutamyltranspeptidase / glutathione hydrolase